MKTKVPLTYDQWIVIGKRLKFLNEEMLSLCTDKRLQARMTKADMSGFRSAINGIIKEKNLFEAVMFRELMDQYVETMPLLSIFYGKLESEPEKKDGGKK